MRTAYWDLVAAMIKDRKPQGFLEWTYVYDMVNKFWEEARLKRASTGLMRGEMFSALMYFLRQIHADGQEPEPSSAPATVLDEVRAKLKPLLSL